MPQQRRQMGWYERNLEKFARTPFGYWYVKKIAPRVDPPLLRLTGGRVSTVYSVPAMLLTTTGAKSGQPRTLPLGYVTDGDEIILIASNYGKTSHPAWYHNLVANPQVDVLAGERSGTYTAQVITDRAERDRAWAPRAGPVGRLRGLRGARGRPQDLIGAVVKGAPLTYPQLALHPQVSGGVVARGG